MPDLLFLDLEDDTEGLYMSSDDVLDKLLTDISGYARNSFLVKIRREQEYYDGL